MNKIAIIEDDIDICNMIAKFLENNKYIVHYDRYGLLASDLWIDTGFHCGEGLEVLVDDKWVRTRMEMNPAREWYLVGTPYCGDLEYVQARIPE